MASVREVSTLRGSVGALSRLAQAGAGYVAAVVPRLRADRAAGLDGSAGSLMPGGYGDLEDRSTAEFLAGDYIRPGP